MFAEFLELFDVILIGTAALDETYINGPVEGLLVVERRDIKIDQVDQFQQALVDVEQRHVTAETASQGAGRQGWLHALEFRGVHGLWPGRLASMSLPMGALSKRRLPLAMR